MKLDISERFVEHNHHNHFDHYEDENYGDFQDSSPFYTQIIQTHPVQSSSQNARLLRNDQCAMTNEETRRLTGLVAKTRALFESSFVSNNNLNRKDSDFSMANSNAGISSTRLRIPNSQSINSVINKNGSSCNTTRNFCNIKQSFSASNVNGLSKFDQDDDHNIYEDAYNEKENKINNKSYVVNYSIQPNNYTKINIGSTNVLNNNSVDSSPISRPTFAKVKRFQSPSQSQSHQLYDSLADKNAEKFSNENEISPTLIKKSQSNNRLVFFNNLSNNNSNNLQNEHEFSRTNGTINSDPKQPKQNLISNDLWSSTIEMREELNIPISVKHAKMCFENLASNKSASNTRMTNLFPTSNTTTTHMNSIHSIPITPITPSSTPNRLQSDLLTMTTKKLSSSSPLNDQTLSVKQRLSPINRKSSTPSPILSSSSSSDSTTCSDRPISVKTPHGIHVSSSNGSISSGVSEIINLFLSSSTSSNSIKSNRKVNSNSHVIPLSSSPTAIFNTNSSSSVAVSSSSSSSSCETTPRSTLNSKKYRPSIETTKMNLDIGLSMTESNDFDKNKCPSVASKIKKLEQTLTTRTNEITSNTNRRIQITKNAFENQSNQVKHHHNLFGSSSSSSTSSVSSSISGSFLNNGDLTNCQDKLEKISSNRSKSQLEKDNCSTMTYTQSPRFVQLLKSQIDTDNDPMPRYRKLEDIISEADNMISKQVNLVDKKEKQLPPKSILRKTPKKNLFENQSKQPEINQQTSELDNTDDLLINNRRLASSLYSSSSSSNFNDSLTMKNICKNNNKYVEDSMVGVNYDHLNRTTQSKVNTESVNNDSTYVKIDNSSCVLPSKLRQRSSSLADSKRTEPHSNNNSNTNNSNISSTVINSTNLNSSNRLSQSAQKINKAPIYIKNNYSNTNGLSNTGNSGSINNSNTNGLVKRVTRNATSASTAREALLRWCRKYTQEYENVSINNFSSSWSNGLAFAAIIHHFMPDAFDYSLLRPENPRHNFEMAFKIAEEKAGIHQLLDVDDMIEMGNSPDWKCVFTYVHAIYQRFKEPVY